MTDISIFSSELNGSCLPLLTSGLLFSTSHSTGKIISFFKSFFKRIREKELGGGGGDKLERRNYK